MASSFMHFCTEILTFNLLITSYWAIIYHQNLNKGLSDQMTEIVKE